MSDALTLLEWPQILKELKKRCFTPYGIHSWENQPFLSSQDSQGLQSLVQQHLAEVDAFKRILIRFGDVPHIEEKVFKIDTILKHVSKGIILNLGSLYQIYQTLRFSMYYVGYFQKQITKESDFNDLMSLLKDIQLPTQIVECLQNNISPEGLLLDSASPELGRLRNKRHHSRQVIETALRRFIHNPHYSQALQEQIITERDGRFVLPVKVSFKAQVPGVVHGGSSSGSTLFVEPKDVVELNNKLQEAQAEIDAEIHRILEEISQWLQPQVDELLLFLTQLGEVDRRLAGARLSQDLDGETPEVLPLGSQEIHLKQASHPLLLLQEEKSESIVANDILIGQDGFKTLIITGPNTGGKTVLLKTVGLCSLMIKAGLQFPCQEGSRISLFQEVFVDIGDAQSIEQNLSTFSGHLKNLKDFLTQETQLPDSLVLIDEIAAGTDPAEGAALARAILDEFYELGALTLVTTHLGVLKIEAHHHPGYMNASVEFNPDTLSPTYRLILGVPGTSNAIAIAKRLGLSDRVIDKSRQALGKPLQDSADLIEALEQKNQKLQEELHKAESFRLACQHAYEQVEHERYQLQDSKRATLHEFRGVLKNKITALEQEMKSIKKQLEKERQNPTVETMTCLSDKLKNLDHSASDVFDEAYQQHQDPQNQLDINELAIGDWVQCQRLHLNGTVQAIAKEKGEVTVASGQMKITVSVKDIVKPSKHAVRALKKQPQFNPAPKKYSSGLSENIGFECDVRGCRVDEALEKVQVYLDKASLAGYERVGIIHGHGTGALKKAIREDLQRSPVVKKYYPADAQDGGDGKTIVEVL